MSVCFFFFSLFLQRICQSFTRSYKPRYQSSGNLIKIKKFHYQLCLVSLVSLTQIANLFFMGIRKQLLIWEEQSKTLRFSTLLCIISIICSLPLSTSF